MAIVYQQIPKEQFRDLIPTFRNSHLIAILQPLVLLHQQIHSHGGLSDRSGSSTQFRNLILAHIARADKVRSRVTYNPTNAALEGLSIPDVSAALTAELQRARELDVLSEGVNPVGGDTNVITTTQLIDVPWKFDGTDQSGIIRLNSELEARFISGPGYLVFGAVNDAIVATTTLESRFNSKFISLHDSTRILGHFQQLVTLAMQFMGEANRVDVPEAVLASERPSGPQSAANIVGETSGNPNATK
jgi:hypothetical protein